MARLRAVRLASLDELEIDVEKLVAGGDGLARFEGVPILVPLSAPGDRLRVRIVERHVDYGRAEIVEILAPGPARRAAPCPYFAACGGCSLQHIGDEAQTGLKVEAAQETLRRLGRVEPPPPTVLKERSWSYRLRAQLQIAWQDDEQRVGYFGRGSHAVIAVDRCPILLPELETVLGSLVARVRQGKAAALPRRLDLAAGDGGRITTAPLVEGLPHGEVDIRVGEDTLQYDARCFFQAHAGLLAPLVEAVVGEGTGGEAYDLYAGVGLFTLPLCRRYERVVAVEGDRVTSRFARRNLRRNRLRNAEVVTRSVESWIPGLPRAADRVVVDPPRSGLARPARRLLLERRPRRLTYVSCHPATLARDLADLLRGYRLLSITYADLFPQTGHLETVVQLEAADDGESEGPQRETEGSG